MQGVVARRNNFTEPILAVPRSGVRGVRRADRPPLRPRQPVQDRRCRHGVRVAGIGGGEHRSGGRLPARAARARRSGRSTSTCSARSPKRRSSRRSPARRTSSSSSAPTSRWPATTRWGATSARRCTRRLQARRTGLPAITADQMPRLFAGVYGLGSRDFRPEHILGAYEFATGARARKDGKRAADGDVVLRARRRSSLRGEVRRDAVAPARRRDRGALPLGRRLGRDHDRQEPRRDHRRPERSALRARQGRRRVRQPEGDHPRQRQPEVRVGEEGRAHRLLHGRRAGAHPRELRPAPRQRRALLRPEGVHPHQPARRHVRGRLPASGSPRRKASRPGSGCRCGRGKQIIDKKIRVFTLPGFQIARKATDRGDLQLRMQGNAFLGAFFAVSPLLAEFRITPEQFREVVHKQYVKKFGRLGEAVVSLEHGGHDAGLRAGARDSRRRARARPTGRRCAARRCCPSWPPTATATACAVGCRSHAGPRGPGGADAVHAHRDLRRRVPRRAGLQPAGHASAPRSASWPRAAATRRRSTSRAARRRSTSPRTARSAWSASRSVPTRRCPTARRTWTRSFARRSRNYVTDPGERQKMLQLVPEIEKRTRELMRDGLAQERRHAAAADHPAGHERGERILARGQARVLRHHRQGADGVPEGERDLRDAGEEERRAAAASSRSSSRICARAARPASPRAASTEALRMVQETEDVNAEHETGTAFLNLLPDTPQKYLGPLQRRAAAGLQDRDAAQHADGAPQLRRARFRRRRLRGLRREEHPAGDCRGDRGLHAADLPRQGRPAARARPTELEQVGVAEAGRAQGAKPGGVRPASARRSRTCSWASAARTTRTRRRASPRTARSRTATSSTRIAAVMRQEAFNHKDLQAVDGRLANGMSVMAMAAHTGCNTVYGSTPPNNPHPYPWMNSLFQDGITVGWLLGESFIVDHARRSVIPERLADALLRPRDGRDHAARVLRVRALQRRADDRPGDPRAAEGLGRRRRRRHGRHRLPEHVEGRFCRTART